MRIKFILFFSFVVFSNAYNQDNTELALAKYHNGSVYIGEKISENNSIVEIRLPTGDTITVDRRFVSEYYDNSNSRIFSNGKYIRNVGSFWNVTLGFNAADSEDERVSSHLGVQYGYRFSPRLSLSAGLAFEFNEATASGFSFDTQFVPVYAYGRYHFFTGRPQIFGFGRLGYGFASENQEPDLPEEFRGGVNAMYGLGVVFASRSKSKWLLSLGHYIQNTSGQEFFLDPIGNEIRTRFDLTIQRLIFTVGLEIN